MSITGGVKFFDTNAAWLANGGTITDVRGSGSTVVSYLLGKSRYTYWSSVGTDDSTIEQLNVVFPSYAVTRLLAVGHNWKQFTAQYWNGWCYVDFTSSSGLDGSLTSPKHANLNAANGKIQFTNALSINWNVPFSISGWVNLRQVVNAGFEFSGGSGSGGVVTFVSGGATLYGAINLKADNGHQIAADYTSTANPVFWNHFTLTYDGSGNASGLKIYINGVLQSVTVNTDTLGSTAFGTTTFSPFINGGEWNDLGLYSIELNQTEINEIMNAGQTYDLTTLSTSGSLTHAYVLNGNSHDTAGVINGVDTNATYPAGGISETAFADNTAYYEVDSVTVTRVQWAITKAQTHNAEKTATFLIVTSELGTLQGFPKITAPVSRNPQEMKMPSGKSKIVKAPESYDMTLNFSPYSSSSGYTADLDLIYQLHDRDTPFLMWPCGGRRGTNYFKYALREIRLQDIFCTQLKTDIAALYPSEGIYTGPVDLGQLEFVEHI